MRRLLPLSFLLLALLGCGSADEARGPRADRKAAGQENAQAEAAPNQANKPPERKIIYTAHINLIVDDLDAASQKMLELLKGEDGYVASSEISGAPGSYRTGRWTVRVPVDKFELFLDALPGLGELERRALDSEDITDRYYDLDAAIKNNQVEEKALRDLLEKSTGKIEDVLAVSRELKNLRTQINQQQGQLERWGKLSSLATVHVTLQERRGYVPPSSPSFGATISRTFGDSTHGLVEFGKGVVLFAVALTPWLPVILVALSPFWLWRRRRRMRQAAAAICTDT